MKLLNKFKNKIIEYINLKKDLESMIVQQNYLNISLNSKRIGIAEEKKQKNVIVSLTSYKKRIDDVYLVIESILQQTYKADKIVLWLAIDEFPDRKLLPQMLIEQEKRGLEIKFCNQIRSYKKIIPSLKEFNDYNIITIDDDIIYPLDFIELFIRTEVNYPKHILYNLGHEVLKNNRNEILSYKKWKLNTVEEKKEKTYLPIGAGGIFYPKGCFTKEVFNQEVFMKLAPKADDLWLRVMGILNDAKYKKVEDPRSFMERMHIIKGSQEDALSSSNLDNSGNDKQLKDLLEYYNLKERF